MVGRARGAATGGCAAFEPVDAAIAAFAPLRAFGVMAARSLSASATISTLPSSIVRLDNTTASGPSASRTRRRASRLVAPTNLRMFKLDPQRGRRTDGPATHRFPLRAIIAKAVERRSMDKDR